jgi:hypothetical protein
MRLCHVVCFIALPLLVGCAGVEHTPPKFALAGQPLPVVVKLNEDKSGGAVSGVVHFRGAAEPAYHDTTLKPRGGRELSAELPTQDLAAGSAVQYYIDVQRGSTFVPLGSLEKPYVVRLVDEVELAVRNMRTEVRYSTAGRDVLIQLFTHDTKIDAAEVVYRPPFLPGEARAPMQGPGTKAAPDHYILLIPDFAVHEGDWQYAVIVWINRKPYRLPAEGWDSFYVGQRERRRDPERRDK